MMGVSGQRGYQAQSPMENMATETAGKPAVPRSRAGAAKGARALGSVALAAREKLRVRERQTAMLVGQIAAQLEDKQPGRIFAVRLTCTRYKSTGTIVFNQRRVRAPMNERDADIDSDDDDSDDEGDNGSEPGSGPPPRKAAVESRPAAAAKTAAAGPADASKQRGGREKAVGPSEGWQQPRRPARQQPHPKPQDKVLQKADRNAISARGHAALEKVGSYRPWPTVSHRSRKRSAHHPPSPSPGSCWSMVNRFRSRWFLPVWPQRPYANTPRRPVSASSTASSPATARNCARCLSPSSRCTSKLVRAPTRRRTWALACSTNSNRSQLRGRRVRHA